MAGRQKLQDVARADGFAVDEEQLAAYRGELILLTEHEKRMAELFGDLLGPSQRFDQARAIAGAQTEMESAASAWVRLGRWLLLIKEHVPHGEFGRIVEDDLGLGYRSARQVMQMVTRLLGPGLDPAKWQARAILPKTKAVELLTLDDDEIDALADGETVAGLHMDAIDRMSTRELRKALRDRKKNDTAVEIKLRERQDRINALEDKLSDAQNFLRIKEPDEVGKRLIKEVGGLVVDARLDLSRIMDGLEALAAHEAVAELDIPAALAPQFDQFARAVADLLTHLRLMGIDEPAQIIRDALGMD